MKFKRRKKSMADKKADKKPVAGQKFGEDRKKADRVEEVGFHVP